MNKVCLVSVYMGNEFPDIIKAWAKSCKANPDFNFLLVSNIDQKDIKFPSNVKLLNITFADLRNRIQKLFKFQISLNKPYKLCDFKPTFGQIFKDELTDYDWWGYTDIDVIYGDMNRFITQNMLNDFERIGMYGHLSMYKNNDKMNNLYKEKGSIFSYKRVFSKPYSYIFDESDGMNMICEKNHIKWFKNLRLADADRYSKRITEYFDNMHCPEVYQWSNGHLFHEYIQNNALKKKEYCYLHVSSKKISISDKINNSNSFIINSQNLIYLNSELDTKSLLKYTEFQSSKQDEKDRKELRKKWFKNKMQLPIKGKIHQLMVYYALFIERIKIKLKK